MRGLRVLVCGGRDYSDDKALFSFMDEFHKKHKIDLVIQGGARGADKLAKVWAKNNDVECRTFDADWRKYGHSAGPIRNKQMIDEGDPDLVIAFSGDRGTANMIHQAANSFLRVVKP